MYTKFDNHCKYWFASNFDFIM